MYTVPEPERTAPAVHTVRAEADRLERTGCTVVVPAEQTAVAVPAERTGCTEAVPAEQTAVAVPAERTGCTEAVPAEQTAVAVPAERTGCTEAVPAEQTAAAVPAEQTAEAVPAVLRLIAELIESLLPVGLLFINVIIFHDVSFQDVN